MAYQLKGKTDINKFLNLASNSIVIDVRSPSEFNTGHIPCAFNIPLFDDRQREIVGTIYKREGRIKAILSGIDLCGPSMSSKLKDALRLSNGGNLLVYCWRGGMRSEAMAWLFSLGDIETEILDGGYKSYRRYILERLSVKKRMIVLGGFTGGGKTDILQYLKKQKHQVIDLEGLANHKGSAFGALGQLPQPSTEHFANLLYDEWKYADEGMPLWVEDESRNIGMVFIPERFYLNMQENPVIVLQMDVKTRLPRLIEEYSTYSREELITSIRKISKRLGGDNTKNAIQAIEKKDFAKAIEISLNYYDKAYLYGLKKKRESNILFVKTDSADIELNAAKILETAKRISW